MSDKGNEPFEIEVDEDKIYAYLFDEDDNEIGFVLRDDEGREEEYYYAGMETEPAGPVDDGGPAVGPDPDTPSDGSLGITRKGVDEATKGLNETFSESFQTISEFRSQLKEISDSLSFLK